MEPASPPWSRPAAIEWAQCLLNSYRRWIGRELTDRVGDHGFQAQALFLAPIVVVSHGLEADPVLNYGNQRALELWETTWEELVKTPSRLTAEPVNRAEREWMLEQAKTRGYIENYRGVRISRSGRRFLVERATVWNVVDATGHRLGQAATFSTWTFL
ncbi:MAG: MEKHLA domain-containing protein [Nitrospiraceae bacterium]|nr:MEKHLA domain-containing protein [Nitrospiraceae bacterium]